MKDGQDGFKGALPVLFHEVYRDSTTIIDDRAGTVNIDAYPDMVAKPREGLVNRIIHDLVDEVVETACIGASDIHGRTFAYRCEPFKNGDVGCIVRVGHPVPPVKRPD